MKRASISQTKNQLSALLDQVRHGETILIMDRDRPVARLEPVLPEDNTDAARLSRLERDGVIRRVPVAPAKTILECSPPKTSKSLLAALLDERSNGR